MVADAAVDRLALELDAACLERRSGGIEVVDMKRDRRPRCGEPEPHR
jgi:hypothetical protein